MALPILALAATLVAPTFETADADALHRAFAEGRVYAPVSAVVTLDVAPDGKVVSCEMGQEQGDKRSVRRICPLLSEMTLSHPAKVDGKPAFGRLVAVVGIEESADDSYPVTQVRQNPEMQLQVRRMPEDAGSTPFELTMQVSPDGAVLACESDAADAPEAFVQSACQALASQPAVARADGEPVGYVTSASVRFVPQG